MVLDIAVIATIVICAVAYGRSGFAKTIVGLFGWIIGLIAAFFLCGKLRTFFEDHTAMDETFQQFFEKKISGSFTDTDLYKILPSFMKKTTSGIGQTLNQQTSEMMTTLLMSLISFILILLAVKIILALFALIFSKEHHHGIIGGADAFFGVIFGIILGLIYIMIGLMVLYLIFNALPETAQKFLEGSLDNSKFCSVLYDHNVIMQMLAHIIKS